MMYRQVNKPEAACTLLDKSAKILENDCNELRLSLCAEDWGPLFPPTPSPYILEAKSGHDLGKTLFNLLKKVQNPRPRHEQEGVVKRREGEKNGGTAYEQTVQWKVCPLLQRQQSGQGTGVIWRFEYSEIVAKLLFQWCC